MSLSLIEMLTRLRWSLTLLRAIFSHDQFNDPLILWSLPVFFLFLKGLIIYITSCTAYSLDYLYQTLTSVSFLNNLCNLFCYFWGDLQSWSQILSALSIYLDRLSLVQVKIDGLWLQFVCLLNDLWALNWWLICNPLSIGRTGQLDNWRVLQSIDLSAKLISLAATTQHGT